MIDKLFLEYKFGAREREKKHTTEMLNVLLRLRSMTVKWLFFFSFNIPDIKLDSIKLCWKQN